MDHDDEGREREIVVIPSLVSLCTTERILGEFGENAPDSGDGGVARPDGNTAAASLAPESMRMDFPSSFPALGNDNSDRHGDDFVPSLRPRQNNNRDTSNTIGKSTNDSSHGQRVTRPITPPIGPQGAPIPRYILNQTRRSNSYEVSTNSRYHNIQQQSGPTTPGTATTS